MDTCDDIPKDKEKSIDHFEPTDSNSSSGSTKYTDEIEYYDWTDISFDGDGFVESSDSGDMKDDDVAESFDTTELSMKRKILEDERMEGIIASMDIKELIKYAYGDNNYYMCLLCHTFFDWKHIAHHYKTNHREVLISRLIPPPGAHAISDAENSVNHFIRNYMIDNNCRFCNCDPSYYNHTFYEHCSMHTGEYPYHGRNGRSFISSDTFSRHVSRNDYELCVTQGYTTCGTYSMDVGVKNKPVYGYLCCDCNYVQLKLQNVKLHAATWHRNKTSTRILKIDMDFPIRINFDLYVPTPSKYSSSKLNVTI